VSHDPYGVGARVFLRIFEMVPDARKLFRFDGMSEMELVVNGLFRIHASRFIRAIDLAVNNLDVVPDYCQCYNISCFSRHLLRQKTSRFLRFINPETIELYISVSITSMLLISL